MPRRGSNLPGFRETQIEFSAHIRNPDSNPRPVDVEPRRMQIYLDLFYNNIEGFLANGFPIAKQVLGHDPVVAAGDRSQKPGIHLIVETIKSTIHTQPGITIAKVTGCCCRHRRSDQQAENEGANQTAGTDQAPGELNKNLNFQGAYPIVPSRI